MTRLNEYPRESVEPVRFERFVVDGVELSDFEWQLVPEFERPDDTAWSPTVDDNGPALRLPGDLPRGRYVVFVRNGTLIDTAGVVELT